ncbi:MAG: DUF881 domain-containing protein [Armatimonadota bacterium]|nr:DUF881 domain-containing protein [bacterium]
MSIIPPSVRGRSWVFQVTALSIVLGMLLALSLKTQRQAANEGVPNRLPALRAAFRITKQDNIKLQKELAEYKDRNEELARQQANGVSSSKSLEQALNEAKLLAGTVAASGTGVIVTLNDSPKKDPSETRQDVISNYVVHDYDIRAIIDELFASGAEAIAINDQRLIANSSVRCVGPVVLVNSVQLAPPYVIKAIGKADVLEKALTLPGGVADALFLLDMIEVKKVSNILVPAFAGSTRFGVARPVIQTRKGH